MLTKVTAKAAILFCVAGAFLALQVSAANATVLDWSYTGSGISGMGTFTGTTTDGGISYTLDSISGTANGQSITGLTNYDGPDQLVFPTSLAQVTSLGFSFGVGSGDVSYNLYEDDGIFDAGDHFACAAVYCLVGPGTDPFSDPVVALDSFTVSVAGVPEPATWAVMLMGFAGLGAALRSRRRRLAIA